MAQLLDDDLMLVNRNEKTYKVAGVDLKEEIDPPSVVDKPQIVSPADGAGISNTDEIDPSGVEFVGSVFSSINGGLTAGSASWQVAEFDDLTYSNPISQVVAHPVMTPQPTWTSGELLPETSYRARTRYQSTTGEVSVWSEDVEFKTAKESVVSKAGAISWLDSNLILRSATSPVKLVSSFTTNQAPAEVGAPRVVVACGVDGQLYTMPELSSNDDNDDDNRVLSLAQGYAQDSLNATGKKALDVWFAYSQSKTIAGVFRTGYVIQCDDGSALTTNSAQLPAGEVVEKIIVLGSICDYCFVTCVSGNTYAYSFSGENIDVGDDVVVDQNHWTPIPRPASGAKYTHGYAYGTDVYSPQNVVMLGDDGYLYVIGGPNFGLLGASTGFANAQPATEYGNDWVALHCTSTSNTSQGFFGFSALKSNGDLWGAGSDAFLPNSFGYVTSGCTSTILGSSTDSRRFYLLKSDGRLHYAKREGTAQEVTTFQRADNAPIIPGWKNFNAIDSNSAFTNPSFIMPEYN